MGLQDGRILKLLLEIKKIVSNEQANEVLNLKKQNASLKTEITKLKKIKGVK